jgi:hypothetical protein
VCVEERYTVDETLLLRVCIAEHLVFGIFDRRQLGSGHLISLYK